MQAINMRHNAQIVPGTKSERTRSRILAMAAKEASLRGVGSITLGGLADVSGMSKSGIYAHFGSMEILQIAVLDFIAEQFAAQVMTPVLSAPNGRVRLKALMSHWIAWSESAERPGGCQLIAASFDYDALEGPVRDHLADQVKQWKDFVRQVVQDACAQDATLTIDPEQAVAFALGLYTTQHIERLLLDDQTSKERALHLWCDYIDRN